MGVQGDVRTYRHPAVIEGEASWSTLEEISTKLTNSVSDINRVIYRLTPKQVGEEILKNLLPIVDDLERVVGAVNSETKKDDIIIHDGIKLIITKIEKYFKKWQVKPIGKPGDILNINLHDAMMVKTEKGKKDNEILEVFEKGYKYKDHVLRHAKVIVNKK